MAISSFAVSGNDAESIIQHVQKKYRELRDATIAFSQTMQFGVMKTEQSFQGTLYLRKPEQYRLETDQQTIVTDGKSIWTFNKANNQVVIDKYNPSPTTVTPERLLGELPSSSGVVLMGRETVNGTECEVLKLIPKSKSLSSIRSLKLWVDPETWLMKKIQSLDAGENTATYSIESVRVDSNLADSLFTFKPSSTVEVIDLR